MGRRSTLRASDADREQISEQLRQATAEGRLLAEELEQRLGAVFSARTYGELDAVVADLPGRRDVPARSRRKTLTRIRQVPAPALVLLVPVAMAMAIAAVVVVVTVFAFWALMITIAWLAFGHRRPYYAVRYRRAMQHHAYGRWRA